MTTPAPLNILIGKDPQVTCQAIDNHKMFQRPHTIRKVYQIITSAEIQRLYIWSHPKVKGPQL
ncbi:hypothetical protein LXL04_016868 [Taraxacum kok-saghyz]